MQIIYQLKWEIKGEAKYAAFQDKELAEKMSESLSNLAKSAGLGEITFEANVVSLYEDAEDFLDVLADYVSDKNDPLSS